MPVNIIIGAQWGDEGKGRITDLMAERVDIVVRYSGGDNAGHTVTVAGDIYKLHLIPSGIVQPNVINLLGSGMVINPAVLLREIEGLAARGVDVAPARLMIDRKAHLITPAHRALDTAKERARGADAIGTTQRGIGPAYTDKTDRSGLRAGLLAEPEALAEAVMAHIEKHNRTLTQLFGADPLDAPMIAAEYAAMAQQLAPRLVDGSKLLFDAHRAGKTILAEGAQGTMLDLDHGTYPFVTSSSPLASGALLGMGLGPGVVDNVVGVAKAFSSRVGSGPFVTELEGAMAGRLRGTGENPWDEYGTTTGRPRRVGWLDLPVLRYAARVNGLTEMVLTKLDVLAGLDEVPICVAYDCDGERLTDLPGTAAELARCTPEYVTVPGWGVECADARSFAELPPGARQYIDFVAREVGVPINAVSVGPGRTQVAYRQ